MTEYQSDDDGSGGLMTMKVTPKVRLSKYPSLHSVTGVLADMNFQNANDRVSFPEYGVDLIGKSVISASLYQLQGLLLPLFRE